MREGFTRDQNLLTNALDTSVEKVAQPSCTKLACPLRRLLLVVLLLNTMLFANDATAQGGSTPLIVGVDSIIHQQAYVVYSGLTKYDSVVATSNIYVIRGRADTVWIYGCGYGEGTDVMYYRGPQWGVERGPEADALDVDSIITQLFQMPRDEAILQFIVPHYHLDHINQEFVDEFYSQLNYDISPLNIYVHHNDSLPSVCNDACCGNNPCSSPTDLHYGAAFYKQWKQDYIHRFTAIGSPFDTTGQVLKTLTAPHGNWNIRKGTNFHTSGTVNLTNELLRLKIEGSIQDTLNLYLPYNRLRIHRNMKLFHYYRQHPPLSICAGDSAFFFGSWHSSGGIYFDTIDLNYGRRDLILFKKVKVVPSFDTQQSMTICANDSALIHGNYQDSAGSYLFKYETVHGCDSMVTVDLSIDPAPPTPTILSGPNDTLTCSATSNMYYWSYNGTPIPHYSKSIHAPNTGTYEVYTFQNDCPSYPGQLYYEAVGIQIGLAEWDDSPDIRLYPNPNEGSFWLDFDNETFKDGTIQITDASGRIVFEAHNLTFSKSKQHIRVPHLSSGIYLVVVRDTEFSKSIPMQVLKR